MQTKQITRGRPTDDPKYSRIAARIPTDLYQDAYRYAAIMRCSFSELVRQGLLLVLEKKRGR